MRKEVIAHQDPKSPESEIFRTLRTNIQFINMKGQSKTILITLSAPNNLISLQGVFSLIPPSINFKFL